MGKSVANCPRLLPTIKERTYLAIPELGSGFPALSYLDRLLGQAKQPDRRRDRLRVRPSSRSAEKKQEMTTNGGYLW
jgi:hypothetical protein